MNNQRSQTSEEENQVEPTQSKELKLQNHKGVLSQQKQKIQTKRKRSKLKQKLACFLQM